jgi:hypothetical protein
MAKKDKNKNVLLLLLLLGGVAVISSRSKGSGVKGSLNSKFYSWDELIASNKAIELGIDEQFKGVSPEILDNAQYFVKHLLDPLTSHTGAKLPIDSWYRVKKLNDAVGGATNSFHLTAQAIDTDSGPNYAPFITTLLKARLPFTELILYGSKTKPSRIHLALVKGRGSEKEMLFKNSAGKYETLSEAYMKSTFT